MDRIIKDFERDCQIRGMAERSINSYHTCIRAYGDYLAARERGFLTANKDDLVGFIESLRLDKGLSLMTVKRYLAESELPEIEVDDTFTIEVSDGSYSNHMLSSLIADYREKYWF